MKLLSFILLSCFPYLALAQTGGGIQRLDYQSEADVLFTRIYGSIPWNEKYRYPEYRDGNVFYTTHKESFSIKLNYNLYYKQIMMISELGDTVFLANFEIVKYILIDKDLYYNDVGKGYFEILSNPNDSIRLMCQRKLRVLSRAVLKDTEKPQLTNTKKLFSLEYIPLNPTYNREVVTLSRDISFFLMDREEKIHHANKSSVLKLFPKSKKQIEGYLAQMARQRTPINFYEEEDLRSLLAFCLKQS